MRHDDCHDCAPTTSSGLSRRGFLGLTLSGAIGAVLGDPSRVFADGAVGSALPGFGQATSVIVLWLNGGPSHIDTFDPKPGTPTGGPTKAIATAQPGLMLSENFPQLAAQMKDVSLIRSMATKEGNHQRARYYLHTGYVPSGTVQHPDLGSLVCQQKAEASFDIPSYVSILGATPGAGVLGVQMAPFAIQDPLQPVENLGYAAGVDAARFDRRQKLREALSGAFDATRPGPEVRGHEGVYAKAATMMRSPRTSAFDLSQEPTALREAYGMGKFGQGVLMARRLIETGVKVVEVQLNGWDTHKDNFNKVGELCKQLDPAFATLLTDLRQRDLLKKTLVVCMGEFGRTPKINADEGRDHFAKAWSMAIAGGPVRGGRVVGATNAEGTEVASRPVTTPELSATLFHALGVDGEKTNYTRQGRPISVVDNGAKPIGELFA